MITKRRSRPKDHEARTIVLWLPDNAWTCFEHIAERTYCSVAEVIEFALDDWAESALLTLSLVDVEKLKGIGRFDVDPSGAR